MRQEPPLECGRCYTGLTDLSKKNRGIDVNSYFARSDRTRVSDSQWDGKATAAVDVPRNFREAVPARRQRRRTWYGPRCI